jgi:hypothetical protein
VALLAVAGCAEGTKPTEPTNPSGGQPMAIELTSTAFKAGERIPRKHTGEAEDLSPALAWKGAPAAAKEFALICDDPDAPSAKRPRPEGPWVHWVLYRIPAQTASLPEGSKGIGIEGMTDFGQPGYGGPMPPQGSGPHRYFFRVYALGTALDLKPGATQAQLLAAMKGHVIAQGELMGTYERK